MVLELKTLSVYSYAQRDVALLRLGRRNWSNVEFRPVIVSCLDRQRRVISPTKSVVGACPGKLLKVKKAPKQ